MLENQKRCWFCGIELLEWSETGYDKRHYGMLTREHLVPKSRGGRGGQNLVDACLSCNLSKGTKTVEEYRQKLFDLTPPGKSRNSALQMLDTWPEMPREFQDSLQQLIAHIDSAYFPVRFYGEEIHHRL